MLWFATRRNQRRAGARARRKYKQLRKKWRRRNRLGFLAFAAALVLVWLAAWWFLDQHPRDNSSFSWLLAGVIVGVLFALRMAPPPHVASWEFGAFGEELTAKELRRLEREGWIVLHDLANGPANFDHVVIGPAGIFCLNSKWSGYDLRWTEDGRLVGRHRYDEEIRMDVSAQVRRARGEAAALSEIIQKRSGEKVWVNPVIVWWGEVEHGGRSLDGVGVVQGKRLVDGLRKQKGRPVENVQAVVDVIKPGRRAKH